MTSAYPLTYYPAVVLYFSHLSCSAIKAYRGPKLQGALIAYLWTGVFSFSCYACFYIASEHILCFSRFIWKLLQSDESLLLDLKWLDPRYLLQGNKVIGLTLGNWPWWSQANIDGVSNSQPTQHQRQPYAQPTYCLNLGSCAILMLLALLSLKTITIWHISSIQ